MESGQQANVRNGASMVVVGHRSVVLQGDYKEIRDGTNYNIYADKVNNYFCMYGQIQEDGDVKVKKKKDYVRKKKSEKDHARVECQHSLKPSSSDRSKVPESISSNGKREKSKDNPFEEINCSILTSPPTDTFKEVVKRKSEVNRKTLMSPTYDTSEEVIKIKPEVHCMTLMSPTYHTFKEVVKIKPEVHRMTLMSPTYETFEEVVKIKPEVNYMTLMSPTYDTFEEVVKIKPEVHRMTLMSPTYETFEREIK